jgi:voltage-gated sodium channel
MSESDLLALRASQPTVSAWRLRLAAWVESSRVQGFIVGLILLNALILGLETSPALMAEHGTWLKIADKTCLAIFCAELAVKLVAYRGLFWRSGWNWFDVIVIGFALAPGAGPWSVLRSLRVLRVLRLLTVVPQLRRVVAAFFHSMPGLGGVVAVMMVFFYTSAVLTTKLFGTAFPEFFGGIGKSFYTLFQIMTLESWSMGIVRPVLAQFPYAWAFFVPFIIIATFTILNLFIGIIVSTMQELREAESQAPLTDSRAEALLARLESDIAELRKQLRKG